MTVDISAVIPAHNPDPGRLARVLQALQRQSLEPRRWEAVLVDNASSTPLEAAALLPASPSSLRIVREPALGLTHARRRGFAEATGRICVLVDDDNVLAPDYLERALRLFDMHPAVGAIGGKVVLEFERDPAAWQSEFFGLLALRDLGEANRISSGLCPPGAPGNRYPVDCAPVGAGMAIRREAARSWMDDPSAAKISDRSGDSLSSAGDNDLVLTIMRHGWEVGYFPELSLTHLIPASRLDPSYLARLNRGIQKSWMQVLTKHAANPWPPIPAWTLGPRMAKAWFRYAAWRDAAAYIRWQGACGHFEGRCT